MKRILFAALAASLVLVSCDRIAPEELIIPNDNGFRSDLYEVPEFDANTDNNTYILFEEFTGHLCSNCPGAAVTAHDLAENSRVILSGVHAGFLAQPDADHPADYTTEAGDEWWLQMTGSFLPCARFNRADQEGDWYGAGEWPDQLEALLSATSGPCDARLQIQYEWAEENGHLNVHVESEFVNAMAGDYRMELSILESGIVSPQSNNSLNGNPAYPSPTAYEYEHEHVFRGNMNGTNGQQVASDPEAGFKAVNSYTIPWPSDWVMDDAELIAVITEGTTGRIINVAYVKM